MHLRPKLRNALAVLVWASLLSALLFASKFAPPKAFHANSYPARDEHPAEKTSVAADPYDMPDKAKIFNVDWNDKGFLPVRLIISNDSDQPVSLSNLKIQLITVNRDKILPASDEDLYRRLVRVKRGDQPSPIPVPLPRKSGGGISKDAAEEIESAQFKARAVEPHSTQSGFLFFDVQGISNPLAGARLYLTGVRDANGQELMYFEIPMEKYLSYHP